MISRILVLLLFSFLNGAISWAWLFTWLYKRKDIRLVGSGNPGASNVIRECGWPLGLLTLVFDAQKGISSLLLAAYWFSDMSPLALVSLQLALGMVAWMGHVYSPFLGFRGGKGVATLIGVYAVMFPLGLVGALLSGLAVMVVFRWFSLGSLVGVTSLPILYFLLLEQIWHPAHLMLLAFICISVVVTWLRHWENIARIVRGEELRLERK